MTVSYRIDRRAHQARLRAVLEGYAPRGPLLPGERRCKGSQPKQAA